MDWSGIGLKAVYVVSLRRPWLGGDLLGSVVMGMVVRDWMWFTWDFIRTRYPLCRSERWLEEVCRAYDTHGTTIQHVRVDHCGF